MVRVKWLMCVVVLLAASGAGAGDLSGLDVPLTVRDVAGVERSAEPCSTGVPLPRGLLQKAEGVAVFDEAGKAVPAQFKVLERWREYGDDESIKWLLVTFLADCPAKGTATYRLRPGVNAQPKTAAKLADGLGPFELSFTDADGKTFTDADVKDVRAEVVESGPVRACVKLEAPSAPPFGFIAWVYTYAGLGRADLVVVLKNTPRKSRGPLYFDDFSVAVNAGGSTCFLGGAPGQTTAGEIGDAPVCLYQASDGTEDWKKRGWHYADAMILAWGKRKQIVQDNAPPFRGYRVMRGGAKIGEGNYALGWAALGDGEKTTHLSTRWFLQNYPSAVEVRHGRVISRLFPKYWEQYGGLHWLDDMQRKRFDLSLRVFEGEFDGARGDAAALAWNRPLVAHCGRDWYTKTGAVGHVGKPRKSPKYKPGAFPRRFTRGNSWISFGGNVTDKIKRRYHSTSMRGFLKSGNPWGAYKVLAAAEHSSGLNCFHVDDYRHPRDRDMLNYGQYCGTFRGAGKYRSPTSHHGYRPWNVAHFKATEVFHGWRLFGDPLAKRTIDEFAAYHQGYVDWREKHPGKLVAGTRADGHPFSNLVECYRVLGGEELLASMHDMAEVCWMQVNKKRGNYGVMGRWEGGSEKVEKPFMMSQVIDGIRAHWQVTHDERALDQILGMIEFILDEALLEDEQGTYGYTYVVKLRKPEAQAKWLEEGPGNVRKKPGSFRMQLKVHNVIFAYEQTGRERYYQVLKRMKPAILRAHGHNRWRYASLWRWLEQDRGDTTPAAKITDLEAEPLGGGRVKLTWTTPADADRLQIKHAAKPMVRRCWPDRCETHANWWAATHVKNEPDPKAGEQSVVVEGVPAGRRVFAIRSFDANNNRSGMSNPVKTEVK
ncbi:MAG: hypothetical protein ACOC8E_01225 [Planctomycetota bacterium]